MEKLVCTGCGKEYLPELSGWHCGCGGFFDLSFQFDFTPRMTAGRECSMWRYREALPLRDDKNMISFGEGFTPLVESRFSGASVLVKQEHLFPSGSYKDRGAALMISKAKELGIKKVVEDSSGNAGAAVAAYCAKGEIECGIYVPADTSKGKLIQIEMYGAEISKITGSREDTAAAVLEAAETIYYASHCYNPYFLHGTKTFAYETAEQLGWKAPDTLILPAGNGTLLLGAHIGFSELKKKGITDKIPKIIGVQAENCAPLYYGALKRLGRPAEIVSVKTAAEGIAIAKPLRGVQIMEAVSWSGGEFIAVNEKEIKSAFMECVRRGSFIEPTSAAVIAGVIKYIKNNKNKSETIVTAFTGHGLKAAEKIAQWG